jgi:hypothetical protein
VAAGLKGILFVFGVSFSQQARLEPDGVQAVVEAFGVDAQLEHVDVGDVDDALLNFPRLAGDT